MSIKHGRTGYAKIGTNEIKETQNWTYDEEKELTPYDSIGGTAEQYLDSGLEKGSGTITVLMDPDDANGQNAMSIGASVELHLTTGGGATGQKEFTGTVDISSRGVSNDKAEPTAKTFNFVGLLTEQDVPE